MWKPGNSGARHASERGTPVGDVGFGLADVIFVLLEMRQSAAVSRLLFAGGRDCKDDGFHIVVRRPAEADLAMVNCELTS